LNDARPLRFLSACFFEVASDRQLFFVMRTRSLIKKWFGNEILDSHATIGRQNAPRFPSGCHEQKRNVPRSTPARTFLEELACRPAWHL